MKTILVVEDDSSILRGLEDVLKADHFSVLTATTGEKGLAMAHRENVDVMILDLGLPDMNGEDVCATLRKEGVSLPILMLTSKSQEMDKVLGLEMGADDYMTKPFSIRELLARVRALLRRKGEIRKEVDEYSLGPVHVDFHKQEATRKGKQLKLSTREFQILRYFVQHAGEVVTRDMLLNDVWGYEQFPTTRTVDNYILTIRKQIEENPAKPKVLVTVHTAGYKLVTK
jgi:DNA-binding response OmpR family regulator